MKKTELAYAMKEMRGNQTQEQLAMELNASREAVSKWENGRTRLPADVAQRMMTKNDNPRFAFATRYEYTQTGSVWLNGPNADLHRSSVKEKTIEEIEEMVVALKDISFAKPLKNLSNWEKPQLENLLEEAVEAITAIEHLVAIVCEEADISYLETWNKHYTQLKAKGWLQ